LRWFKLCHRGDENFNIGIHQHHIINSELIDVMLRTQVPILDDQFICCTYDTDFQIITFMLESDLIRSDIGQKFNPIVTPGH